MTLGLAALVAILAVPLAAPVAGASSELRVVDRLPGRQVELRASQRGPFAPPLTAAARAEVPAGAATSDIQVSYNGFSAQARAAFQVAVDIWERRIVSPRVIHVKANWKPLGAGILGSAGPDAFYLDDVRAYPAALAEATCDCELQPNSRPFEIVANFNSSFSGWYLGTDGSPAASQYDFVTVVLHELGHGLGFLGSFGVSGNLGGWGLTDGVDVYPLAYDEQVWSAQTAGNRLTVAYDNPSAALKTQLTDGSVYFAGSNVVGVLGGRARLYAPSPWEQGSSVSHFDEDAFPMGTQNALMTPFLANGEVLHNPGALTLALFRDIGWTTATHDGTAPNVGVPQVNIRSGVSASNSGTPVPTRVTFSASDPTGIVSTDLERRFGGGAFTNVAHSPANATAINVALPAHNATQQQLRSAATDGAGNKSAFASNQPFLVRVFQEGNLSITQTGTWNTQTATAFFGGAVRHASASGREQELTLSNVTDLAVVSTLGPNRGKALVFVDGVQQGSAINLYSSSVVQRRIVFSMSFATPGTHTIEFRPTGTRVSASSGTRADFDAFIAIVQP